ncbi:MAG: hypothetical protein AAF674_18465 [Pseudomonadota bacterium]
MTFQAANPNSPALQGKPDIDIISVQGAGDHAGKTLTMHVSAELMKNQTLNAPISPTGEIKVVQNAQGVPLVFSLAGGALDLLHHDADAPSGWSAVALLPGFAGYVEATAFDVVQANDGKISLTVALSKTKGGATDLFTAWGLTSDLADWGGVGKTAHHVPGLGSGFRADHILMSTGDAGAPLCVATGQEGGAETRYHVPGNGGSATPFKFPQNVEAKALIQMTAGAAIGQRAFYYLYNEGEAQSLIATTIAENGIGSSTYSWSPGDPNIPGTRRYTAIATPVVVSDDPITVSSDLFAATKTEGILVYPNARSEGQVVAKDLRDAHALSVHHDGNSVSVWALLPKGLYYIKGTRADKTYTFGDPVLFATDITQLGAIRNRKRNANELFAITGEGAVRHWWQDPGTTNWRSSTIRVKDQGTLVDQSTYTTHINLSGEQGSAIAPATLSLTASEWTYATVNGRVLMLDDQNPVAVQADAAGNVTVAIAADDLSVPILHAGSGDFAGTVSIWPNGKVQKGLAAVKDGDGLRDARTQGGGHVFDTSQNNDVMTAIAGKVGAISQAGATNHPLSQGQVFAKYDPSGSKATDALASLGPSVTPRFAMTYQRGKWVPTEPGPIIEAALSVDSIVHDVGDFFKNLAHAFDEEIEKLAHETIVLADGVSFALHAVEKAGKKFLHFVLTVAERTFEVVLDTLSSAMKALTWILDRIGGALLKLLEWLGFAFLWEEIWKTHKLTEELATSLLDWAVEAADTRIDEVEKKVLAGFDLLEEKLADPGLPDQLKDKTIAGLKSDDGAAPSISLHAPQFNYASHHMLHSAGIMNEAPPDGSGNPIIQLVNDIILPSAKAFGESFVDDLKTLVQLFKPGGPDLETLFGIFKRLSDNAIKPVKALVKGMFEFLKDLIGDFKAMMEGSLDIPFLGGLYRFVTDLLTGGKGEKLSVINGLALILAVPMTAVTLVFTGRGAAEGAPSGGFSRANIDMLLGPAGGHQPQALAAFQESGDEDKKKLSTYEKFLRYYNGFGGLMAALAGGVYTGISSVQSLNAFSKLKGAGGTGEELQPITGGGTSAGSVLRSEGPLVAVFFGLDILRYLGTIPMPVKTDAIWVDVLRGFNWLFSGIVTIVSDFSSLAIGFAGPTAQIVLSGVVLAVGDLLVGLVSFLADGAYLVYTLVEGKNALLPSLSMVSNLGSNLGGIGQGIGLVLVALAESSEGISAIVGGLLFVVGLFGGRLGLGTVLGMATATLVMAQDDGTQIAGLVRPAG